MTKNARNQAGLLAELAHAGYPVSSLDELRTSGCRYVEAVPILLRELERETEPRTKEWIVRTLSVPWAKPAAIEPMLREFRDHLLGPDRLDGYRWAVGNALWVLWDDKYFDEYMRLGADEQFGRAREMLILGFERSKRRAEASEFLLGLLSDADVEGHAISALAKLAQSAARPALEEASIHHPKTWVRNAAKRGVAKIDRLAEGKSR